MDIFKIGITGASGFIGNALARALLKDGHIIKCLVRKTSRIEDLIKCGIEIFYGDVIDPSSLGKFTQDCDILVHAAAIRGEKNLPYETYQMVNVRGTLNLLEESKHIRKIIFISTVGVSGYGLNIDERSPYKGASKYHRSKIEAEEICRSFPNVIIVRPAIVYGEGDNDGMIYKLCNAIKRKRFLMIGAGLNKIQMVNIHNLIKGINLIIKQGSLGEKYIVADESVLTFREILDILSKNLGVGIPPLTVPKDMAFGVGIILQRFYSWLRLGYEPILSYYKVELATKSQVFNISKIKKLGYYSEIRPHAALAEFARDSIF